MQIVKYFSLRQCYISFLSEILCCLGNCLGSLWFSLGSTLGSIIRALGSALGSVIHTPLAICNSRTVCRREFAIPVVPLWIGIPVLVTVALDALDTAAVPLDDAHVEERLRDYLVARPKATRFSPRSRLKCRKTGGGRFFENILGSAVDGCGGLCYYMRRFRGMVS